MKAVFFDATGTLIHLPFGVGHHYALVARRHGLELNAKAAGEAFLCAWKEMPQRPATHSMKRPRTKPTAHRAVATTPRAEDDKGWWRILVRRVLELNGAKPNEAFFEELYAHFAEPGVWALYPEVRAVLDHLSGKFRLGIISNFDGRLRKILADLEIASRFDTICISSEVGADKPDPFIFQSALAAAAVSAAEALHAGDDPDHDWAGAAAAGMRVFRLDRRRNTLSDLLPLLQRDACGASR